MSPEEEEQVNNYLGNLGSLGRLCDIRDINNVDNPIISGRITKIIQFNSKQPQSSLPAKHSTMIFFLKETLVAANHRRDEFKIIFLDEAARIISNAELTIKDHLAVHNPKYFRNSQWPESKKLVLIVGAPGCNELRNIYGRGRTMEDWHAVQDVSTKVRRLINKKYVCHRPNEVNDEDAVRLNGDYDNEEELSRPNLMTLELTSTKNHQIPTTSIHSKTTTICTTSSATTSSLKQNQIIAKTNLRLREQQNDIRMTFQSSSVSRNFLNNAISPEKINSLNSENVRLADVKNNMIVTVFGVIVDIGKMPIFTANGKYYTKIEIIDETIHGKSTLQINIYTIPSEAVPTFRLYDVIKLSTMKMITRQSKLMGTISSGKQIVTYAREDPAIIFQQSQSYTCSDDDFKRVAELIQWMQKEVPDARIFTPICNIKLINTSVNLSGYVVDTGIFINSPNLILRFRDGTSTTEKFWHYDLTKDNFGLFEQHTSSLSSDEVDILITDTNRSFLNRFKKMRVGSKVELHDVRAISETSTYKANVTYAVKLLFKAINENLRIIDSEEPMEKENLNEECDEVCDTDENPNPELNSSIAGKRRLFDSDDSLSTDDGESNTHVEKRLRSVLKPSTKNTLEEQLVIHGCIPCEVKVPRIEDIQDNVLHLESSNSNVGSSTSSSSSDENSSNPSLYSPRLISPRTSTPRKCRILVKSSSDGTHIRTCKTRTTKRQPSLSRSLSPFRHRPHQSSPHTPVLRTRKHTQTCTSFRGFKGEAQSYAPTHFRYTRKNSTTSSDEDSFICTSNSSKYNDKMFKTSPRPSTALGYKTRNKIRGPVCRKEALINPHTLNTKANTSNVSQSLRNYRCSDKRDSVWIGKDSSSSSSESDSHHPRLRILSEGNEQSPYTRSRRRLEGNQDRSPRQSVRLNSQTTCEGGTPGIFIPKRNILSPKQTSEKAKTSSPHTRNMNSKTQIAGKNSTGTSRKRPAAMDSGNSNNQKAASPDLRQHKAASNSSKPNRSSPLVNRQDRVRLPGEVLGLEAMKIRRSKKRLNCGAVLSENGFTYYEEWPESAETDFWIQVNLISTIPPIRIDSSDGDVLSLIVTYCKRCEEHFPSFQSYWVKRHEGFVSLCPKCRKEGTCTRLTYEMILNLQLVDRTEKVKAVVARGSNAEQFLDCTISELCNSTDAQKRVRTFIHNCLWTRTNRIEPLLLKVKILETNMSGQSPLYVLMNKK